MKATKTSTLVVALECQEVELNPQAGRGFFRARLQCEDARLLADRLDECAAAGREWYFLSWKPPALERLSLVHLERTPAYERQAGADYLVNQIFRVTGRESSCNVNFSGPVGGPLLASRIRRASARAQEWLEIRVDVISRKRCTYLIRFVADLDAKSITDEHDRLAQTAEVIAAQVWGEDDFSDWERADA